MVKNIESQLGSEKPDYEENFFQELDKYISERNLQSTYEVIKKAYESLDESFLEKQKESNRDASMLNPAAIRDLHKFWHTDKAEKIKKQLIEDESFKKNISSSEAEKFLDKELPDEGFFETVIRHQIIEYLKERNFIESNEEQEQLNKIYAPRKTLLHSGNTMVYGEKERVNALTRAPEVFGDKLSKILRHADIYMNLSKNTAALAELTNVGFTEDDVGRLAKSESDVREIAKKVSSYVRNYGKFSVENPEANTPPKSFFSDQLELETLADHYEMVKGRSDIDRDKYSETGYSHLDHGFPKGSVFKKKKAAIRTLSKSIHVPEDDDLYQAFNAFVEELDLDKYKYGLAEKEGPPFG